LGTYNSARQKEQLFVFVVNVCVTSTMECTVSLLLMKEYCREREWCSSISHWNIRTLEEVSWRGDTWSMFPRSHTTYSLSLHMYHHLQWRRTGEDYI